MSMQPQLKALVGQLRANQRLRLGVWAILAIVLFSAILECRDDVRRQGEAYRTVSRKLARAQQVATQTEWISRVERARAAQLEVENRLWRETSLGLAQASFQDWLNQAAVASNAGRAQISVSVQDEAPAAAGQAPDAGSNGLWRVNARLSFDFAPQTLYQLLLAIEAKDRRVVIESLAIRGPRAEMQLVAYFRKPAESPPRRSNS